MDCITCGIVEQYVGLANDFTQELSTTLLPGMWALFGAIVGIWIILHGYTVILASDKANLGRFVGELIPVMIAGILLQGQGPELVNAIYYTALNTMGAAASMALSVGGGIPVAECASCGADDSGLISLVATAEAGIGKVLDVGNNIVVAAGGWADTALAFIYAIILVLPYILVLIVFFSQVVIAIFRLLMIAALSPFLMLGFAFGWGRSMAVAGARTVLASFMVLFGTTCALAVMLYGVNSLTNFKHAAENWESVNLLEPEYLVAVALGWMGSAFMTEATSIANSITGSVLNNSGLAILTGAGLGATYAAGSAASKPIGAALKELHQRGTYAAGGAVGAASYGAQKLMEQFKNHDGGFKK